MTTRQDGNQGNQPVQIDHQTLNVPASSIKVDSRSLTPVFSANDAYVGLSDQTFYFDFTFIDPSLALHRADADEPLKKTVVARAALTPNASLRLLQQLAASAADLGVTITLVLGGQVVVNNDEAYGPVNK